MGTEREFDAIFYDLGGTLRLVERDAAFEAEARKKIAEMCGEKGDPDAFCKFLDYRYAGYRKWCFETMREAPEEELWTKWLAPEYDRDLSGAAAGGQSDPWRPSQRCRPGTDRDGDPGSGSGCTGQSAL